VWSGGNGTFDPSTTNMNATYTPTAAEIANGNVTLTLTTTGNGSCNQVADNITLNFTPSPVVNAGADVSLCANNAAIALNGSVTGATGGVWSGGLGSFTPNNTTLNATYTPTAAEIAAGTLTLTLTSTGNNNCNQVSDSRVITFTPAPTVNAGANGTVCANNSAISLNGSSDHRHRSDLERRHGHLQPEQQHAERDLHTERCGAHSRYGNTYAHYGGQR
jgi:hypothetical protein